MKHARHRRRRPAGRVAPRVGAWVETSASGRVPSRSTRSRPAWARGLKHQQAHAGQHINLSRPAWARGLKHPPVHFDHRALAVAPRVGAWVETSVTVELGPGSRVAPRVGAWVETRAFPGRRNRLCSSRPAWARGLKLQRRVDLRADLDVAPRVGAWVETSSRPGTAPPCSTSRPAWARGLKLDLRGDRRRLRWQSRPAWARGLKLQLPRRERPGSEVAPRVGAWVETSRAERQLPAARRRAPRGRVG